MSEMVERVAKAINEADEDELLPYFSIEVHKRFARAAIEAMREPTDVILKAIGHARAYGYSDAIIWKSAIDSALAEGKTE